MYSYLFCHHRLKHSEWIYQSQISPTKNNETKFFWFLYHKNVNPPPKSLENKGNIMVRRKWFLHLDFAVMSRQRMYAVLSCFQRRLKLPTKVVAEFHIRVLWRNRRVLNSARFERSSVQPDGRLSPDQSFRNVVRCLTTSFFMSATEWSYVSSRRTVYR